jgi:hypothetical protein
MVFVFALHHGAGPAIRTFSITHHIGAAAWPLALVSMALCEVTVRLVVVQLRGNWLTAGPPAALATACGSARRSSQWPGTGSLGSHERAGRGSMD